MTQHKSRRVHVQIVRLQSHENHVECFYREALLGTKQIAELLPVATHGSGAQYGHLHFLLSVWHSGIGQTGFGGFNTGPKD